MVWAAEELLPQASVAVHVRVMLYEPAQAPGVVISLNTRVKAEPQASLAVATANTGEAGQSIVVSAGNGSMKGAVTSWTLMVWAAEELLPQASVAIQLRVMLYEPTHAPGVVTSLNTSVNAEPQASEAVATANTGTAGQSMVESAGSGSITGAVTSWTLMVWAA